MIAAFAAGATGSFGGFLFGVPRAPRGGDGTGGTYQRNTNLEQVSDWLTKIIVGVGLIQVREIGDAIFSLGERVGSALGTGSEPNNSGTIFAISLMAVTAIISFQLTYMWTTIRLYKLFSGGRR
jgi:hypothetical protein